jgi:hypothetical protein
MGCEWAAADPTLKRATLEARCRPEVVRGIIVHVPVTVPDCCCLSLHVPGTVVNPLSFVFRLLIHMCMYYACLLLLLQG